MTVLVTGGAGFVGSNVVHSLLSSGENVRVLDNLSRSGVEKNLRWLTETHGSKLDVRIGDVRDPVAVRESVHGVDHVYHFAAQVAVTTSLTDPVADFQVNALGTLNVLEAVRAEERPPSLVYTSTNKVYGALGDLALVSGATRYTPDDASVAAHGIGEARPLSFHSPYGCSKGTADQYVLDYAHTYGLRAVVFRMSCIYGPRQLGNEDQGWVAHFLVRALRGEPLAIYGDGKQVRDVLFVDDLVAAFSRARARIEELSGRAFNMGGGPGNTLSLAELIALVERMTRRRLRIAYEPWRRADQRYYVSDTGAFERATGWTASTPVSEGVAKLHDWLVRQPEHRTGLASGAAVTGGGLRSP